MPANDVLRHRLQSLVYTVNNHRLLFYALASVSAVVAVVVNALKNYSNFYSVAIYLSKSSRSVLALANFCFLIALLCGHLVQRIFFGPLRANEVERLYDRLWFFITESLLAFTIFRDEFDTSFGFMFGFLLFVKSFHWLASDRIEWMDQRPYPGPPVLFHIRMLVLFFLLWTTDLAMFVFTIEHSLTVRVDGMVLFASEYAILISSVLNTISKYLLSSYELRRAGRRGGENAPPWENKSMWTFYIELVTDFMKLSVYLVFFTVILTFYGLPLNIVRDVYITARSFITRLRALHRYQTATRNMDQRYPNATEEELTAMSDRTCIICREEMVFHPAEQPTDTREGPNMTPKKLPCGHIFHFYCLRSWLERQQSCPTCRRTVLDENPTPPPPAPGQVPQAGNPAPANPNQPVNNNPFGNPLGFVNRILGPPNAAQNNDPFVQNLPAQNAAPAAPNVPEQQRAQQPQVHQVVSPVRIHYEVQYQGQRTPLQQPAAPRQVPRFPGIGVQGPNGEWQPWPQNNGPEQNPPPSNSSDGPSSNGGVEQQSSGVATPPVDVSSETTSDEEDLTERLSPREAARAAALRRYNTQSSAGSPTAPTPTPTPTSATAPTATSSSQPQSPSRVASSSSAPRSRVTSWIPLYDLLFSSDPQELPTMIRSSGSTSDSLSASSSSLSQSRSLNHIPSHVNEEQLAVLDQLTREAIDERLRVLEGVSNTVYRCMDDLMRVRSALPPVASSSSGFNNSHTTQTPMPTTSSRRDEKRPATSGLVPEED